MKPIEPRYEMTSSGPHRRCWPLVAGFGSALLGGSCGRPALLQPVGWPRHAACGARCHYCRAAARPALPLIPDFLDHLRSDQAIEPRAGWNERRVHVFIAQLRFAVGRQNGDGRFEPAARVGLETVAPGLGLAPPFGRIGPLDAGHGKLGLEMRAATFVAGQRPFENRLGQREHVEQRFGEHHVLIGPLTGVGKRTPPCPDGQLRHLLIGIGQRYRCAARRWQLWSSPVPIPGGAGRGFLRRPSDAAAGRESLDGAGGPDLIKRGRAAPICAL